MTYTQSTTTGKSTTTQTTSASTGCGCGCGCGCREHTHKDECCKLTCFERPSYFCGQLLSDADLTLQENYFREKNKLYHRTIDGYGVVCGLRMRCDRDCKGRITIGDGYAIDCCGNDLVVCEPRTFDVIGELRRKKWLVEAPPDPCDDEKERREREHGCISRKCYYIGICYSEEPAEYVTPYTTDCSPGPGPCQPTRIREGVRFEIYDKLPHRPNPLEEMEKRIERCFRIFREGQFSRGLALLGPRILEILDCGNVVGKQGEQVDPNEVKPDEANREEARRQIPNARHTFSELRALFLHELRTCPDQYNCDLERLVFKLHPPARDEGDGPTPLEAFTRLLELIEKHVFSCVLGELAFLCPEPPKECCVIIGSVEIENGRLTRVINYPRWYLWCFANLLEVLVYTLANEAACGRREVVREPGTVDEPRERQHEGCCPGFEVDVCEFLNLFLAENRAGEYAARASVQAIRAVKGSLVSGFDFTSPHGIAPAVFRNMTADAARTLAKNLNLTVAQVDEPVTTEDDFLSGLARTMNHRGDDPLLLTLERDKVSAARGVFGASAAAVGPFTYQAIADVIAQQATTNQLLDRINKLESEVATLKAAPGATPGGNVG